MKSSIWMKQGNKRSQMKQYFLYDTYETYEEALKTSKWYNKKNPKNKGWIMAIEVGFIFPTKKYALYMTRVRRLF